MTLVLAVLAFGMQEGPAVGKPPAAWKLDPFYEKHLDLDGLPIVGSVKVSDSALREAWRIGKEMLRHLPEAREAMIRNRVRVAIMAPTEQTLDIPEHADLQKAFPQTDWNRRARGLGATKQRPAVSGAEENLLGLLNDRYKGESIFIHEFAHAIFEMGLEEVDPKWRDELKVCFESAKKTGLWERTYARENPNEYWAEGVQSYFDANQTADPPNGIHNAVGTRPALERYDPGLFKLIDRAFRTNWRWSGPPKAK